LAVIGIVAAASCGSDGSGPSTQPSSSISQQARGHLDQLLDIMQANSIKRLTIDWTNFRARVLVEAATAQTIPDT
jgi:hypothetical protein